MTLLPNLMLLLVVLLGPTASGKTALSLHVAERLQGEIVSCDSVAVYREFEIGTAKPSREERRRIPHHLIDVAGPEEAITAGDYSRLARQAVGEIAAREHLPIIVGSKLVKPVMFPPGLGKLVTKPLPIGSEALTKTMGSVRVF